MQKLFMYLGCIEIQLVFLCLVFSTNNVGNKKNLKIIEKILDKFKAKN